MPTPMPREDDNVRFNNILKIIKFFIERLYKGIRKNNFWNQVFFGKSLQQNQFYLLELIKTFFRSPSKSHRRNQFTPNWQWVCPTGSPRAPQRRRIPSPPRKSCRSWIRSRSIRLRRPFVSSVTIRKPAQPNQIFPCMFKGQCLGFRCLAWSCGSSRDNALSRRNQRKKKLSLTARFLRTEWGVEELR